MRKQKYEQIQKRKALYSDLLKKSKDNIEFQKHKLAQEMLELQDKIDNREALARHRSHELLNLRVLELRERNDKILAPKMSCDYESTDKYSDLVKSLCDVYERHPETKKQKNLTKPDQSKERKL